MSSGIVPRWFLFKASIWSNFPKFFHFTLELWLPAVTTDSNCSLFHLNDERQVPVFERSVFVLLEPRSLLMRRKSERMSCGRFNYQPWQSLSFSFIIKVQWLLAKHSDLPLSPNYVLPPAYQNLCYVPVIGFISLDFDCK